ncbi:hypothetical protein LTR54_009886 [Friedmanniomyces endolithicus]|uniref:Uncharacterized protein n=1 Tax=Friedmanniomyces endolithicus TaxID=329885 RepID=A0AAN6FKW1_9PEZI|nr:hypothetical protein LTR82_010092 [Friedmanniomyces endolithicus]KAK0997426.1 hypothetical protein LTR54_009886 [Friedmanniomyces endolithicus]
MHALNSAPNLSIARLSSPMESPRPSPQFDVPHETVAAKPLAQAYDGSRLLAAYPPTPIQVQLIE